MNHAEDAVDGVAMTVHRLPEPVLPEQARTRSGRIKMIAVLLVCAAPVIASYFTFYFVRPEGGANYSELISPPLPMPDAGELPLTDLQGGAVVAEALKGQWLFVVVAGADCDATCEGLLVLQRQLRETLGKERERVDPMGQWMMRAPADPDPPKLKRDIERLLRASASWDLPGR